MNAFPAFGGIAVEKYFTVKEFIHSLPPSPSLQFPKPSNPTPTYTSPTPTSQTHNHQRNKKSQIQHTLPFIWLLSLVMARRVHGLEEGGFIPPSPLLSQSPAPTSKVHSSHKRRNKSFRRKTITNICPSPNHLLNLKNSQRRKWHGVVSLLLFLGLGRESCVG